MQSYIDQIVRQLLHSMQRMEYYLPSRKLQSVTDSGRDHDLDSYERAVLPTATQQRIFKIQNGQLEGVTPVLKDGRPVALLWLEPNHAAVLSTVGTVVRIALAYDGFALLANILPIFLIVRIITRPLRRLQTATIQAIEE